MQNSSWMIDDKEYCQIKKKKISYMREHNLNLITLNLQQISTCEF